MSSDLNEADGQDEIDAFEAVMSEEGLDSQQEDMQTPGDGAGSAESEEDEAGAGAGAHQPHAGEGEDAGEAGEAAASGSPGGVPGVPEGYADWGDFFEKTRAEQSAMQGRLDQTTDAARFAAQQAQAYRQQLAAMQQQGQQPPPNPWAPVQANEHVVVAAQALQLGKKDLFDSYPEPIRQAASQYVARQTEIQQRLLSDPQGFVRELAAPLVYEQQQQVQALREQLVSLQLEKFRRDNADLIGDDVGAREYLELSHRSNRELAFEVMRLRRAQAQSADSQRDQERQRRDQQAKRSAARGSGRRPQPRAGQAEPRRLSKKDAADPHKVAEAVLEEYRHRS